MMLSMCIPSHGNKVRQGRFGSAFLFSISMLFYTTTTIASEAVSTDKPQQPATNQPLNLANTPLSGLSLLEQAYEKSDKNQALAVRLASTYIQLARETSDQSYYRKADKLLKPWAIKTGIPGAREKPVTDELRLIRATLAQHNHDYQQASDDLLYLIRKHPKHTQAWLTLSSIQLVQANYPQAEVSCTALSRISSYWLASLCYSQLYSFTGSAERAYGMQKSLLTQLSPEQIELRVWVSALMAETAMRLGWLAKAEQHFQDGLAIKPDDIYILRTYSEFLLTQNRATEVIKLLEDYRHNDQLLLRLAMAIKDSGDNHSTLRQQDLLSELSERLERTIELHGHAHDRDMALFLLELRDDAQRAFRLAELNWQVQKEPDDALLLLRAAKTANKPGAIQQLRNWIEKHQLQDVRLNFND
ncbi:MAG: hypothetical protein R3F02_04570 [Thiolinea sp.]